MVIVLYSMDFIHCFPGGPLQLGERSLGVSDPVSGTFGPSI